MIRRLLCFMKFHRYKHTQTFVVARVRYDVIQCRCGQRTLLRGDA